MKIIIWLLFYLLFIEFAVFANQQERDEFYLQNNQTNTTWRLAWSDEFDSVNVSSLNWSIEHEEEKCHGNNVGHESCNVRENVSIVNGTLVLQAKHQKHNEYNYTAAAMTSKREFGFGRLEIRATQPIGRQLRTCIITKHAKKWPQAGQIDICAQQSFLNRGIFYSSNAPKSKFLFNSFPDLSSDINKFHLYGFEWNANKLVFFFDQQNLEPFILNATHFIDIGQKIRFQIGVGLNGFSDPMPKDSEQLFWKIPTFEIDYIRYYKEIPLEDYQKWLDQTMKNKNMSSNKSKVDNYFRQNKADNKSENAFYYYYTFFGIIFFLVIFVVATTGIVLFLNSLKRKVEKHSTELTEISLQQQTKSPRLDLQNLTFCNSVHYEELPIEYILEDSVNNKPTQTGCEYSYIEMQEVASNKKSI